MQNALTLGRKSSAALGLDSEGLHSAAKGCSLALTRAGTAESGGCGVSSGLKSPQSTR